MWSNYSPAEPLTILGRWSGWSETVAVESSGIPPTVIATRTADGISSAGSISAHVGGVVVGVNNVALHTYALPTTLGGGVVGVLRSANLHATVATVSTAVGGVVVETRIGFAQLTPLTIGTALGRVPVTASTCFVVLTPDQRFNTRRTFRTL